jgi:hypothetical protein
METLNRDAARGPMNANRSFLLPLVAVTAALAVVILPPASQAQAENAAPKPGTAAAPAQRQTAPQKPGTDSAPAQAKPQPIATKPAPKPKTDTPEPAATAKNLLPANAQPTLLGQYDNWGAYWAAPDGRKICFAAARPGGSQSNRSRHPTYFFITSRPHDKIKDEVSAILSFPLKSSSDATASIGGKHFVLAAQADGVWVKNTADEMKLIEAMRKGGELVLKGTTDRGLQSTDTFSLKGLPQALDRIARECK